MCQPRAPDKNRARTRCRCLSVVVVTVCRSVISSAINSSGATGTRWRSVEWAGGSAGPSASLLPSDCRSKGTDQQQQYSGAVRPAAPTSLLLLSGAARCSIATAGHWLSDRHRAKVRPEGLANSQLQPPVGGRQWPVALLLHDCAHKHNNRRRRKRCSALEPLDRSAHQRKRSSGRLTDTRRLAAHSAHVRSCHSSRSVSVSR